jgi:2-keto-4-pentenoate hydratase/2-oxohepta-3-ene-1,7-dioic acid hydratase in catechol pathway
VAVGVSFIYNPLSPGPLKEAFLKFINFSRPSSPAEFHVGCSSGDLCLDITDAIKSNVLKFPIGVSRIEDVLRTESGLEILENQFRTQFTGLKASSQELQRFLIDESAVVLQAPILRPQKLIGIGLNYRDHAEETKMDLPKEPLLFAMYSNAITAPNFPIVIPGMSRKIDYEAELAVVIGSTARHVRPEEALEHVAGYTIVNDVSARDLQRADGQWLRAKSFDTFAPMGPCMVTRSSLGDGDGLAIELRLNGQTLQKSNTRNLIFKVPALVSHISKVMTLEAGDVISTGTPGGVGFTRKPPVYLQPGDVVEIEVEGIGILRNPVADSD